VADYILEFERPVVDLERRLDELKRLSAGQRENFAGEIKELEIQIEELKKRIYSNLSPWQKVQVARHADRPLCRDYIDIIFSHFVELHGDRLFRDDAAIIGGPASLDGEAVMIVGEQKGRGTRERLTCNFGMPHPEGYRKALRLMKLGEKFSLPIISFIDTPGAFPGVGAEERGQALAIATNLMEMSRLTIPIIVVNIGEGGSGGALALGVGDKVIMLENAYYSVSTPEACASILYKDTSRAAEAADSLRLTADVLLDYGLIDSIVEEPLGGAHRDPEETAENLKRTLKAGLNGLKEITTKELLTMRYARFRKIGHFKDEAELGAEDA
jgi:acetyl-CoA carboxylase carboxyl transferase subunit alpha